jgi:hypothetical protein
MNTSAARSVLYKGHRFGRPVPAAVFKQLLEQGKSLPAQSAGDMRQQTLLIVDDGAEMGTAV